MTETIPKDYHWVIIQKGKLVTLCVTTSLRILESAGWKVVKDLKVKDFKAAEKHINQYVEEKKLMMMKTYFDEGYE